MKFTEKQYFKQISLWVILLVVMASSIVPVINVAKTKPLSVLMIISPTLIIMALFFIMNLKTVINTTNISIQFYPFIRKPKKYNWSDISRIELIKYNPLLDYGGWGIRGFSDNKAYNIQGNIGLKLYFKDNTKLLIGTQKPKELNEVIAQICKDQKITFRNSLT